MMDLASAAMGNCGKQMVRFFLIAIQGGVCCCFIRLISTDLAAALRGVGFDISNFTSTFLTTSALLPMAVLRFVAQLSHATLLGNACLFTAVISVVVFSSMRIIQFGPKDAVDVNPDAHAVFDCVSTLFYAFEGVGVILPIENSMRNPEHFGRVLVSAMSILAVVFVLVGALASIAFPHTGTGSITAFLVTETGAPYFQFVNGAVTFGVFLTFPLQLFPLVEAIMEILEPRHIPGGRRLLGDDDDGAEGLRVQASWRNVWYQVVDRENIVRVSTVFVCAFIALGVQDLGLLVALVGAVGSTGLVMVPCAVHLQMQRLGIVERNWCQSGALIVILVFCSVVLVLGTASAFIDIVRAETWA